MCGAAAGLLISILILPSAGLAHDAKSGWTYPYACCSNNDCREVPASVISERPEGYVINTTGEVVAYSDRRVRQSPDGVYHWCSVAGADTTRTICLFVPPKSF
ncbi:hypothetical protein [Chelativorans sp. AA-79]|uniref:hypothetical protein n=1 Tax=Chelativorans sp. AA-79 TaxID=3028735 RepID=UPI0023F95143|nr:hypothetical protein [Chelativorans sp. AA-79]WEX11898.1 hypothetical protein PVE73_12950 [Chelativorans sp. AA-79]